MTTLVTNTKFKQFDLNGEPLASGLIYTYEVGTTTAKTTYQDADKVAANTNPVVLDSFGEATIYIDGDTKLVVKDSDGVTIRTYDSISDVAPSTAFPVISSPLGGIYRSDSTETGYIKIRLPMSEWPNAKVMMSVMIYEDVDDSSFVVTAAGYASSVSSTWDKGTAKTTGTANIAVQFGNDGTYPAIYIGAVDSEWTKPQIAIVNFLAGEYSYESTTWSSGWNISITTTLGTITETKTAISDYAATVTNAGDITTVEGQIGWGAWQTVTQPWTYPSGPTYAGLLKYRKSNDGTLLQIILDASPTAGSGNEVYDLPAGYHPATAQSTVGLNNATYEFCNVTTGGHIFFNSTITTGTATRAFFTIALD